MGDDHKFLLDVRELKVHFPVRRGLFRRVKNYVYAVDGVSLRLQAGRTLGLVGESGCGKTTLGRTIMRLYSPTAGQVIFDGTDITHLGQRALRPLRRHLQMIFQDPFESLNSRHTIGEILEEPFIIHKLGTAAERQERVAGLLTRVGLNAEARHRFVHEFSGGQRQRIGIARAVALSPRLIVCDEPVSALDVSIRSQIINLLLDLQQEFNLAYLFIAHDLAVVKHISDDIAVMYLGNIMEQAPSRELYANPRHPYTQALIAAIPIPDPQQQRQRLPLPGDVPSPMAPPAGCVFHPRCRHALEQCRLEVPQLMPVNGDRVTDDSTHLVACWRANEIYL